MRACSSSLVQEECLAPAARVAAFGQQLARELSEEVASPSCSDFLAESFRDAVFFGVQLHVGRVFVSVQNFIRPGKCRLTLLHGRTTLAAQCLATHGAVSCRISPRAQQRWHDLRALAGQEPDAAVMLVVPVLDELARGGQPSQAVGAGSPLTAAAAVATITVGLQAADIASTDRALSNASLLAESLAPCLRNYSQRVLESFAKMHTSRSLGSVPSVRTVEQPTAAIACPAPTTPKLSQPRAGKGCSSEPKTAVQQQQGSSDEEAAASTAKPRPQPNLHVPRHSMWLYFPDRTSEQLYASWYSLYLHKVQAVLDLLLLLLLCAVSGSPQRLLDSAAQPIFVLCVMSAALCAVYWRSPEGYVRHREGAMQLVLLLNVALFWNVTQPSLVDRAAASVVANGGPASLHDVPLLLGAGCQVAAGLVAKVRLTRYLPVLFLHCCAALLRGLPKLCSSPPFAALNYCRAAAAGAVLLSAVVTFGALYLVELVSRSLFVQQLASRTVASAASGAAFGEVGGSSSDNVVGSSSSDRHGAVVVQQAQEPRRRPSGVVIRGS